VRDREPVATLLETAAPATLTTYRADGSAITTPAWFRFETGAFEIVIAEGRTTRAVLLRLAADGARVWHLSAILPGPATDRP
jgi:hypothetical protein